MLMMYLCAFCNASIAFAAVEYSFDERSCLVLSTSCKPAMVEISCALLRIATVSAVMACNLGKDVELGEASAYSFV